MMRRKTQVLFQLKPFQGGVLLTFYTYSQGLERQNFDRLLYLAIAQNVFLDFFSEEPPQLMIEFNNLKLLVFDPDLEEVLKWIV